MTTAFLRTVITIIRKDLQAELRSRELVNAMALFAFLSIIIFSFALELNRDTRLEVIGGILWVTLIFSSVLGLNRSLVNEREHGNLDAMLIAPVDRVAIYVGKMVGNFLFVLIVGLILLPLMTVLYNVSLMEPLMLVTLILGVLGFTSVGTLIATMTVQTRSRETLLPIAMMPITLPIILLVVRMSSEIIDGSNDEVSMLTLIVLDAIYLGLGAILFDFVVED